MKARIIERTTDASRTGRRFIVHMDSAYGDSYSELQSLDIVCESKKAAADLVAALSNPDVLCLG